MLSSEHESLSRRAYSYAMELLEGVDGVSGLDRYRSLLRTEEYDAVVEERANDRVCGYPACQARLIRQPPPDEIAHHRLSFCSQQCLAASIQYRNSLQADALTQIPNNDNKDWTRTALHDVAAHAHCIKESTQTQDAKDKDKKHKVIRTDPNLVKPVQEANVKTTQPRILKKKKSRFMAQRAEQEQEPQVEQGHTLSTIQEELVYDQTTNRDTAEVSNSRLKTDEALWIPTIDTDEIRQASLRLREQLSPFSALLQLVYTISRLEELPEGEAYLTSAWAQIQRDRSDLLLQKFHAYTQFLISAVEIDSVHFAEIFKLMSKEPAQICFRDSIPSFSSNQWKLLVLAFIKWYVTFSFSV